MCKICSNCKGVMNYDPYFNAEVCVKCGKMERIANDQMKKGVVYSTQSLEIFRQLVGVKTAQAK